MRLIRARGSRALVVAVLAMTVALLAACSSKSNTATTAPTKAAGVATSAATAAGGAAAAATTPAGAAGAAAAIVKVAPVGSFGQLLTDASGKTLYIFSTDQATKSTCNASCATAWPPLTTTSATVSKVDGASGDFTVISRDDGTKQVAYAGHPLYRFSGDSAAGTAGGNGISAFGGVWSVAKATPSATSSAPSAPNAPIAATASSDYGY